MALLLTYLRQLRDSFQAFAFVQERQDNENPLVRSSWLTACHIGSTARPIREISKLSHL